MSDKVKIYTGKGKKGFAPKDADESETAIVSRMNNLTKICDLMLEGKEDQAVKKIRKLGKSSAKKLFETAKTIAATVEFSHDVAE